MAAQLSLAPQDIVHGINNPLGPQSFGRKDGAKLGRINFDQIAQSYHRVG